MKLGDIIDIKHGYAFSGEHIIEEDNNIVLVTPGNFKIGGGFQEKKCKFYNGEIPKEYVLKEGDYIVTMTDLSKTIDTLGYSAIVPKSIIRTYLHNQRIGLIRFKDNKCDKGYIYWLMRTHGYQKAIANTSTGSTVHHTSPSKIYDYEFDAPNKAIQHQIAKILSRYDSLIENYQRQIKLLEEAAQRLYKEWFIDLHFPGHESTRIVDNVPEKWKKMALEDICDLSKKVIQPSQIKEGCPYIGLEHMPRKDFCLSEWGNSEEINSSKYEYKEDDILFGKIRPYFHKVGFAINDGYASTDSIIMQSKPGVWALLLMTVFSDQFVNYTSQTCKEGAKMPRADWNQMKKYPVLIASDTIQKEFERQCKLMANKIKANALQIQFLTEARDRLLPKLISGEISVEAAQSVTSGLGVRKEQTDSPQASD